jgi:hypothetical protein
LVVMVEAYILSRTDAPGITRFVTGSVVLR